jgi:guanine deaminase
MDEAAKRLFDKEAARTVPTKCRFWARGSCYFGSGCRNIHEARPWERRAGSRGESGAAARGSLQAPPGSVGAAAPAAAPGAAADADGAPAHRATRAERVVARSPGPLAVPGALPVSCVVVSSLAPAQPPPSASPAPDRGSLATRVALAVSPAAANSGSRAASASLSSTARGASSRASARVRRSRPATVGEGPSSVPLQRAPPFLVVRGAMAHCPRAPWPAASAGGLAGATPAPSFLELSANATVVVDSRGLIAAVAQGGEALRDGPWSDASVCDVLELSSSQMLLPGFVDTHIHAPQLSFAGAGLDVPLLEWLQRYTFPAERRLGREAGAAEALYPLLVRRLLSAGTTTALYFGSLDVAPCKVLARACADAGQRALVGKVSMDRLGAEGYQESSAAAALQAAEEFVCWVKAQPEFRSGMLLPVVTPRFIPSCSPELLAGLGALARRHGCHVQSHLSESLDEVELSAQLHPGEGSDTAIFDRAGLLGPRSVMAHAVHLSKGDLETLVQRGCAVAHCPLSNFYFAHGLLPAERVLRAGLKLGLGTDVAGGYSCSMMNAQRSTVLASLAGAIADSGLKARQRAEVLDYKHAFYLATQGGAVALGLDKRIGCFKEGLEFDALVLDARCDALDLFFDSDTLEERFQKLCTLGDDRNVARVFVRGREVHVRPSMRLAGHH